MRWRCWSHDRVVIWSWLLIHSPALVAGRCVPVSTRRRCTEPCAPWTTMTTLLNFRKNRITDDLKTSRPCSMAGKQGGWPGKQGAGRGGKRGPAQRVFFRTGYSGGFPDSEWSPCMCGSMPPPPGWGFCGPSQRANPCLTATIRAPRPPHLVDCAICSLEVARGPLLPKLLLVSQGDAVLKKPFKSPHPDAPSKSTVRGMGTGNRGSWDAALAPRRAAPACPDPTAGGPQSSAATPRFPPTTPGAAAVPAPPEQVCALGRRAVPSLHRLSPRHRRDQLARGRRRA